MLGLVLPTDEKWAVLANESLAHILVDHAYCEQKAASNGISLIIRYPDRAKLVEVISEVVEEEWSHFMMVMAEMRKRNIPLGPQRVDEYAVRLKKMERKNLDPDTKLLDKLLVCAIIEARSCERFKILSETVEDESLIKFYKELMISEAGHYATFTNLAREYFPKEVVAERLAEMLIIEGEVISEIALERGRIH